MAAPNPLPNIPLTVMVRQKSGQAAADECIQQQLDLANPVGAAARGPISVHNVNNAALVEIGREVAIEMLSCPLGTAPSFVNRRATHRQAEAVYQGFFDAMDRKHMPGDAESVLTHLQKSTNNYNHEIRQQAQGTLAVLPANVQRVKVALDAAFDAVPPTTNTLVVFRKFTAGVNHQTLRDNPNNLAYLSTAVVRDYSSQFGGPGGGYMTCIIIPPGSKVIPLIIDAQRLYMKAIQYEVFLDRRGYLLDTGMVHASGARVYVYADEGTLPIYAPLQAMALQGGGKVKNIKPSIQALLKLFADLTLPGTQIPRELMNIALAQRLDADGIVDARRRMKAGVGPPLALWPPPAWAPGAAAAPAAAALAAAPAGPAPAAAALAAAAAGPVRRGRLHITAQPLQPSRVPMRGPPPGFGVGGPPPGTGVLLPPAPPLPPSGGGLLTNVPGVVGGATGKPDPSYFRRILSSAGGLLGQSVAVSMSAAGLVAAVQYLDLNMYVIMSGTIALILLDLNKESSGGKTKKYRKNKTKKNKRRTHVKKIEINYM
jgi:hypothetical protein